MRRVISLACLLLGACHDPTPAKAPASNPPERAASDDHTTAAPAPHAQLDKTYTGQGAPSLLLKNDFPMNQHVFVDWEHVGEVASHKSQTFELSAQTHTITCADSTNPDQNPIAITETFENGFAYTYVIVPR